MAKIHPTAIVDGSADLADDVEIQAYCVVESDVKIGPGCVLRPHAIVRRNTTLGRANLVDSFTVLGGLPQDLKFAPATVSYLRIGDENVFREGVTISRATGQGKATVVGNRTYWMAGSHAGHEAVVEDETILTNGSALGGRARLARRAILGGNAMIHQFTWVGEMAMIQGQGGMSMHVPPYTTARRVNRMAGLNSIGLRRADDISDQDRLEIKEAFRLTYRSGLTPAKALERMDACTDWSAAAGKFRDFVRRVLSAEHPYNRGLCPHRNG